MKKNWPTAQLGAVLKPVERPEVPKPGTVYRQIGVKLWGMGAYERKRLDVSATRYTTLYRTEARDVIVNKIWARNGSVAVVPDALAGCYGSGEFPMFTPDQDKLDPRWIHWLTKTPGFWAQCDEKSQGTSGQNRIRADRFLEIRCPLPPLAEQRRVVTWIEQVATQTYEARTLRRQAAEEANALTSSHLGTAFAVLAKKFSVYPLGELTSHIVDGPHQTPQYLPEGVPGVPFVTVKNMVTGALTFTGCNYISEEDHGSFTKRYKAEHGDVLYSEDGATRGRPCLVPTGREFSYFVSVALIKPLRDRLDGRYLVHVLGSNWITDRMIDKSRGDMIPHIVLREIRAYPIPLPPLPDQYRIVAELDAFHADVDRLRRLQTETAVGLDALLPALLERAFKGDL